MSPRESSDCCCAPSSSSSRDKERRTMTRESQQSLTSLLEDENEQEELSNSVLLFQDEEEWENVSDCNAEHSSNNNKVVAAAAAAVDLTPRQAEMKWDIPVWKNLKLVINRKFCEPDQRHQHELLRTSHQQQLSEAPRVRSVTMESMESNHSVIVVEEGEGMVGRLWNFAAGHVKHWLEKHEVVDDERSETDDRHKENEDENETDRNEYAEHSRDLLFLEFRDAKQKEDEDQLDDEDSKDNRVVVNYSELSTEPLNEDDEVVDEVEEEETIFTLVIEEYKLTPSTIRDAILVNSLVVFLILVGMTALLRRFTALNIDISHNEVAPAILP